MNWPHYVVNSFPDPRLLEAKARCERVQDEEGEKEAQLLEETAVWRNIIRAMGHASVLAPPENFPKEWQGPKCRLIAKLTGTQLTIEGCYSQPVNSMFSYPFMKEEGKVQQVTIVYTGRLIGHAFIGKVIKDRPLGTILTGTDGEQEFIGTVDPQLMVIELLVSQKKRTILKAISE